MEQNGLTVITNVNPGQEEKLRRLVTSVGQHLNSNESVQFQEMTTVHYTAWLILPRLPDAPPRLVLETNYDGDLDTHLDDFIAYGAVALDQIYACCENYPIEGTNNVKREYLKAHSVRSSAYFVAFPGRSLADIRNAIATYREAERYIDEHAPGSKLDNLTPDQVMGLVRYFREAPAGQNTVLPMQSPVTQHTLRRERRLNLVKLVPVLPFLPFLLIILCLIARLYEILEARRIRQPDDPTAHPFDEALYGSADQGPQNHLCTFAMVKASRFRVFTLKTVLFLTKVAAKRILIFGKLGQLSTVHFARWILIDNDSRLLFLSNFDGSWGSYMRDFSDHGWVINAIWSGVEDFPATKFMLGAGAYHLEEFKRGVLRHFVPAPVFYSAYRDQPVQTIQRELIFRDDLAHAIALAGGVTQ